MDRLVVFLAVLAVAGTAVVVLQRRTRPDPPSQPAWRIPAQLDRSEFLRPDAPWLVVLFSSATCDTCASVWPKVEALASDEVAVQQAEVARDAALHERYRIDAVPTVVIADDDGVVRGSFVGPVTATDLWATLAELREPGSVPPGCEHGA